MVNSLKLAFERANGLCPAEQEVLAAIIQEELDDEIRWQKKFAATPGVLQYLSDSAKAEHKSGKTTELEFS